MSVHFSDPGLPSDGKAFGVIDFLQNDRAHFTGKVESYDVALSGLDAVPVESGSQLPEPHSSIDALAPSFLNSARHPFICLCHFAFKVVALLCYIFGSFLFGGWNGDFVFTFVTTTVFISIDFWIVKNISGRLLVGMRWWHLLQENGSNQWFFETQKDGKLLNAVDRRVFWSVLYLWSLIWVLYLLYHFVHLQVDWLLLDAIGFTLAFSNLVGYWKCYKETQKTADRWAVIQVLRSAVKQLIP